MIQTGSSKEYPGALMAQVAFWIGAIFLLLYALGFRSLWGSEDRWAEVVREMLLFGDFFHPQINGQPYFDKPLFTYWVIIPAAWMAGSLDELSVRLPSALAGLVTLWATFQLGKKILGGSTGLVAASLLLASWGFCFWSRTAAADAENMAVIVVAVLWYFSFRNRPSFGTYLGFYLICALGSHFKGLTAWAVPIVVALPDIFCSKRWKAHISFPNAAALAVAILVYLAPFVYAGLTAKGYGESGLVLAMRENVLRFFNAFDHKGPVYCYLYYVPFLFLPWVFVLAGALGDRIKGFGQLDERRRWLCLAVLGIFLLFTISSSRRSYYILPIVPFLALMIADFLIHPVDPRRRDLSIKCQFILLFIIGVFELSSPLVWPVIKAKTGFVPPHFLKVSTCLTGLVCILCMSMAWLRRFQDRPSRAIHLRMAPLLLGAFVLLSGFFCFQQNALEVYRTQKPFILKLKAMIAELPPERIGLSKNMAGVVFYLDKPMPVADLEKKGRLTRFLKQEGEKIIIARKRDAWRILPALSSHYFYEILSAPEFRWSKRNDKGLIAWKIF